jgi:hypothetical protein
MQKRETDMMGLSETKWKHNDHKSIKKGYQIL